MMNELSSLVLRFTHRDQDLDDVGRHVEAELLAGSMVGAKMDSDVDSAEPCLVRSRGKAREGTLDACWGSGLPRSVSQKHYGTGPSGWFSSAATAQEVSSRTPSSEVI
jgi:hypothetical protein